MLWEKLGILNYFISDFTYDYSLPACGMIRMTRYNTVEMIIYLIKNDFEV